MRSFFYSAIVCIGITSCGRSLPDDVSGVMVNLPDDISYNFHVKPILSDRCYACHGPDGETREAGLRLDIADEATSRLESGHVAIVSGKVNQSALVDRILSHDPETMMPPPDSKLSLLPEEKAILIKWIDQGAKFEPHWSFIKPERPDVPQVDGNIANPIDAFVLASLPGQGLMPSQPAEKERLLKRVYMDLTGLPPTVREMDAFLENDDQDAYETVVDKLLSSDAHAERLTMEWMDVSRYADSHGLHADGWRNMWPWRDWVIDAFKNNMPYDQFITMQLAGDLLPNAGREEILATAFHRNHPMTAEGGAIDEEFRLEYVADRTNTTATVLMGLTMECARCHDHKFDPISQAEYYSMTAFFNNQKELGMTGDDGNYGPILTLESPSTRQTLSVLDREIMELNQQINQRESDIESLEDYLENLPEDINPNEHLAAYFPMESLAERKEKDRTFLVVDGNNKATSNGSPSLAEGIQGTALEFDQEYDVLSLEDVGGIDVQDEMSTGMWINTTKRNPEKTQVLIGNAGNKNNFWRGWDFYLDQENRLCLRLIHSLPHNYLHIRTQDSIPVRQWTHVAFTYDGSGEAQGGKLFINGRQEDVDVVFNQLNKNIRTVTSGAHKEDQRPLYVSKSYRAFTGDNGIFEGKIDELRIYDREVSNLHIARIAGVDMDQLSDSDRWSYVFTKDPKIGMLKQERAALIKRSNSIRDTIPEIMVMEEMQEPRPTYVLDRGQYNTPLEEVDPATPVKVLPFGDEFPTNRLGLAEWLFHPDHPLTSRTTVNRYWQMIFGSGIVKTANDFGSQGALPSHPELLDWLAVEFRESGWDLRALLKMMVMSSTYRQSSVTTAEQRTRDPENVYLSYAPSYRWPAEMIRDNALAASGLLIEKVGGPSVKPYQPDGLWIEKGTFSHMLLRYEEDQGENLYRRSLYTFIKRTSPPPAMTIFDVPSRDVCTVTRESTNTPLQALVLLNDPQFVEAARVLAERIQREGQNIEERAILAFRLVTGRKPTEPEVEVLKNTYDQQYLSFTESPSGARELLAVGDFERDPSLPLIETAALTVMSSSILNHDEAYMKR